MANPFDIDQLRREIEALIRDNPGVAEDETLRADMLDGETEIKGALAALLRAANNDKTMVEAIGLRVEQLGVRRARIKARYETLRGLMLKVLQSADLKRLELPEATISQRNGQPQIVGEPDVDELPEAFVRVTIEPNHTAIRHALLSGHPVPGLFLSNAPPTLAINTK